MVDRRNDPFRTFNFRVEIGSWTVGSFSEVTGLSSEGEVAEYRAGDDVALTPRKLIGLRSYSNITLKRGYSTDDTLWRWYNNIVNGINDRRDGAVILMNEAREPVMRWEFRQAWINKIEAPGFNASNNDVAIESIELVHEELRLVVP